MFMGRPEENTVCLLWFSALLPLAGSLTEQETHGLWWAGWTDSSREQGTAFSIPEGWSYRYVQ